MGDVVLDYQGIAYRTETEVYAPHDDTWMLVDAVRRLPLAGRRVVEVGCGAGLGLIAALMSGATGVGIDRNPAAVRLAHANAGLNGVGGCAGFMVGDLLGAVDLASVDIVLFNPPYLPTGPHERLPGALNLAFDGGPTGNETLLRFVAALEAHGAANGRVPAVLLVTSSLNDRKAIHAGLARAGLEDRTELEERSFPYERLYSEWFQRG